MPPTPARAQLRRLVRHPRIGLALRSALAAGLAWLVARQLPGIAQDYAFYAPFGAVATMHPVVSRTVRESLTGVAAIGLGVVVGLTADALLSGTAALVVVVGVGVLVAGLRWLGASRSYVPIAGLFVLVLGQGHEMEYAAAYAGLFLLGAGIGMVVTAALPTLPVRAADDALAGLREDLARQLRDLADGLDPEHASGPDAPAPPEPYAAADLLGRARGAVGDLTDAVPGNPRARGQREAVGMRAKELAALERVALLAEDLGTVSTDRPWGSSLAAVPAELRTPLSDALRALARTVVSAGVDDTDPGARTEADAALTRLGAALAAHARRAGADADTLLTAAVVTTLRRALSSLTPGAIVLASTPTGEPGGAPSADDDGPPPRGGDGPS